MDWIIWLLMPLVGALGGFLAGMLGVGGGIIFIPLLTWVFANYGLSNAEVVKYTLANSIFLVFVSGLSGIYRQARNNALNWKKMLLMGIPGACCSLFLSLIIAHGLPDLNHFQNWFSQTGNWYHKQSFQMVFLLFLIISILNMAFGKPDSQKEGLNENDGNRTGLQIMVSAIAGCVVALSGLGGGVVMVPLFSIILKMPLKKSTALSLSIIPFLSIAPLVSYLFEIPAQKLPTPQTGYLVWQYALPIAVMVAIFATLGLKTAKSTPVKTLRIIFATLTSIVLIKTIYEIIHQ
jgi:uncharacterized membrane protein YfcA